MSLLLCLLLILKLLVSLSLSESVVEMLEKAVRHLFESSLCMGKCSCFIDVSSELYFF